MQLAPHIHYLLFRHDCVTVPGFGSFLVEQKEAYFDAAAELYYPPVKQVSFNEQLQSNDGILAKHIANTFGLTYEEAVLDVHKQMSSWKEQLQKEPLTLEGIGVIAKNPESKLVFTPQQGTNFLAASYALDEVPARLIFRGVSDETAQPPTYFTLEQRKSRRFIGYAAAIAALVTLAVGSERYLEHQADAIWQAEETQRQEVRAQAALSVYDLGSLPTLKIDLPTEQPIRKYHIIAGSFRSERNASKLAKRLKLLGYYDAQKLPQTARGFYQVSFSNFPTKREAYNAMADIKDANYPDAWVLKK
jgi:hypothetical protein